jgi:hypothetical protein
MKCSWCDSSIVGDVTIEGMRSSRGMEVSHE